MAIDLPGIDVGPTGSQALSVGATLAPDPVPHYYPPTVNLLLAAISVVRPTKVAAAAISFVRMAPRSMAAGMKSALWGIGPAAGRRRHSLGGKKVMRRST